LLIYPTAIYFFVAQKNKKLAHRIEKGLLKAIADGSFDRLLKSYPTHAKAFKDLERNPRQKHFLHNPLLPIETPLKNHKLWYQPYPEHVL
jgi:hypothetical protein